ncbi:MAG TPA: NUDIX domain-containing protein [Candidatus Nanoarchaeia archaeon]|nr:NUDIX domain-containing protein [Candidatus Nanoarchaeia archaeon]
MSGMQKVGTSAFIYKQNKVLVLKRSKSESPFPGNWEIPGGGVKFGEDTEDALRREVKEETTLKIKIIQPYTTFSYIWKGVHRLDIQYLCRPLSNKITLSDEHDKYLWATKDQVKKLKMSSKMRVVILKGFEFITHN